MNTTKVETSEPVAGPVKRPVRRRLRPICSVVINYWLDYYVEDHCTLCGNRGWIDSRGVTTPAGVSVGRMNYCICPNGQSLRAQGVALPNAKLTGLQRAAHNCNKEHDHE